MVGVYFVIDRLISMEGYGNVTQKKTMGWIFFSYMSEKVSIFATDFMRE